MEKQNNTVLIAKTVIVFIILGMVYIGFETIKKSSFEYQKQSVLVKIKEFSNKYVKDEKDKKVVDYYIRELDKIFSKYRN